MANPNSRGQQRDKPFRDALRMQIAAAGDDHKALRDVADKLLALAMSGDMQAIKELADRIDGKVAQPVSGADGEPPINILHKIERIIVDPQNRDSEGIPPTA